MMRLLTLLDLTDRDTLSLPKVAALAILALCVWPWLERAPSWPDVTIVGLCLSALFGRNMFRQFMAVKHGGDA